MKKTLLALVASVALLAGCTGKNGSSTSSSTTSTSTTTSTTSQSSSSSSSSSTSTPVVHTAEEVMKDFCIEMFGKGTLDENYWSDGGEGFYTGVMLGAGTESDLLEGAELIASCAPTYLIVVAEPFLDEWEDGSAGGFALFATEDYSIGVDVGTYVESGALFGQVSVYPVPEM